jgi:hypothetical protein
MPRHCDLHGVAVVSGRRGINPSNRRRRISATSQAATRTQEGRVAAVWPPCRHETGWALAVPWPMLHWSRVVRLTGGFCEAWLGLLFVTALTAAQAKTCEPSIFSCDMTGMIP